MLRKKDIDVEDIKSLADKTGFECTGPTVSLLSGRVGVSSFLRVFSKGERCLKNVEKADGIFERNSQRKTELEDLYTEAEIGGSCRFWQQNDKETFQNNAECQKIQDEIKRAEDLCYSKK